MTTCVLTQTAIFGDGEVEPSKDTAVSICVETCRCGLPKLLANKLALLDFEARKDAAQACVCCQLLLHQGFTLLVFAAVEQG